jgi:hypothetical protein
MRERTHGARPFGDAHVHFQPVTQKGKKEKNARALLGTMPAPPRRPPFAPQPIIADFSLSPAPLSRLAPAAPLIHEIRLAPDRYATHSYTSNLDKNVR